MILRIDPRRRPSPEAGDSSHQSWRPSVLAAPALHEERRHEAGTATDVCDSTAVGDRHLFPSQW